MNIRYMTVSELARRSGVTAEAICHLIESVAAIVDEPRPVGNPQVWNKAYTI